MAKMNWNRVHIEDKDWRHRMSMEIQYEPSTSVLPPKDDLPPASFNKLQSQPNKEFKFSFEINFHLPAGKHTPSWLVIKTLPRVFLLISDVEESIKTHIRNTINSTIPIKGVSLNIRDTPLPFKLGQSVAVKGSLFGTNIQPNSTPIFKLAIDFIFLGYLLSKEPIENLVQKAISFHSNREYIELMQLQVLEFMRQNKRVLELEAKFELDN